MRLAAFATGAAALAFTVAPLQAADLTLPIGGRVVVELIGSEADFRNTLSVTSPAVAVALSGCTLEAADGLGGTRILSEKTSQRGCRADLDSDAGTAGIQGFTAGTVLRFGFCAQTDADPACEFVWSSNPASNADGDDHVQTVDLAVATGFAARLSWEDQQDLGDMDFDDLIVVVRVAADADGDGLWDDWETTGVDSNGDGTIDLDLPLLGADPQHKDIFVEIDWMDCSVMGGDCAAGDTHSHQPRAAALQAVVDAFADVDDVTNPDLVPGITIHLEQSNAIAHQNTLVIPNLCFTGPANTGFDAVKADPNNFGPANPRRFTHHYNLWTHRQVAGGTASGCGELPGNDFQVSFGGWNYFCSGGTRNNLFCDPPGLGCPGGGTCQAGGDQDGDGTVDQDVGTISEQAGTLMHELGHNLGLGHGGGDWANNKPNYLSVMNYTFQVSGVPPTDPDGAGPLTGRVDYSRSVLVTLVESSLSEPVGIGDGTDNTFFACPGSNRLAGTGAGNAAINWNCDTDGTGNPDPTDLGVSSDVNLDAGTDCVRPGNNGALDTATAVDDVVVGGRIREGPNRQCDTMATPDDVQWRPVGPLTGYDDWANIKYDFQNTGDFDDGLHSPRPEQLEELTFEVFQATLEADIAVSLSATPSPVLTGSLLTHSLMVANLRPAAARAVVVNVALPATTSFASCSAGGGGVCGGAGNLRTVSFDMIPGGTTVSATIEAAVNCELPDGTMIVTQATSTAQRDSDSANDSATATATASNPPPAIAGLGASPAQLWPPNHKLTDVDVSYTITDNCGVPTNSLSVSSSEPVNGPGDGNTAPDWEVLDATHVRLRAERSGGGSGRVYTILLTSADSGGGSSSATTTVLVPHQR